LLSLLAVTQSFHFSTLEEYYVGGLYLGVGNGVTDGSIILIGLFLFTGFFGPEPWLHIVSISYDNNIYQIQFSHLFAYCIFASQILAVMLNFYLIFKHQTKEMTAEERETGEELALVDFFKQVFAFYLIFLIVYLSLYTNTRYMLDSHPFVPCLICSFIYVHNTINVQVAHVSKQKYRPFNYLLLVALTALGFYTQATIYLQIDEDPYYFYKILAVCIAVCQFHFILNVIYEITVILGIRVFRVKEVKTP